MSHVLLSAYILASSFIDSEHPFFLENSTFQQVQKIITRLCQPSCANHYYSYSTDVRGNQAVLRMCTYGIIGLPYDQPAGWTIKDLVSSGTS